VTSADYEQWDWSFVFVGESVAPEPTPTAPVATATPEPPATASTSGEYLTADALLICLPFDRSRFAERDADGEAVGVDVEMGQEIAAQLGRDPQLIETLFDELIGGIEDRTCDVTIGGQFITQERLARIDMIPYREGTPHVIVQKGNPLGIDALTDLCGRRFAVVGGTVYVDMVHGVGDFVDEGLNAQCTDSGAALIDLREYDSQADAEQALADGDVDAYAGNDFVTIDQPGVYELTVALPLVRNGIGHFLGAVTVDTDIRAALRAIIDDGTYADILDRYGVPDVALTIRP
jgi:polar amino acid transport system substrate-binding protein